MKNSKEQQNLIIFNVIGLALCATAHIFPSGFNFIAAVIGLGLVLSTVIVAIVRNFKRYNEEKNKTEQTEE